MVRDIEYLRDFFDAPLEYVRGKNCYRYDPGKPVFELPGLFFNESELFALLAVEQLLDTIQPGILRTRIGPLKGRIRRLLAESGHSAEELTRRILIQPATARSGDPDRFATVAEAVLTGQVIHINYHGRERDRTTDRHVHCARLVHYRDNWYLLAWCERARGLRSFALDRIRQAQPTGEASRIPIDSKALDRYLNASFGIFSGEAEHWAVLRFNQNAARWVADETWHPDQIDQWQSDHFVRQIPYSDPRELLREILKYGPDVEVLKPQSLRQSVQEQLRQALVQYGEGS